MIGMSDNSQLKIKMEILSMVNNSEMMCKSFEEIKSSLSMHVSNKFLFREDQVRAYNGVRFEKTDWSSKNMRRIYFSDCDFYNVNFKSAGFTGSIFKNCKFTGGILDAAIFDECLFFNCNFSGYTLKSTSFCKSEFIECIMNSMSLDACFFTDVIFNEFEFNKCDISDIIWENAKFLKCLFKDTLLQKLNFEFTYFANNHFDHSSIPFASIPFVFGGIEYILNTEDEVYIKTIHPAYEDNKMSKMQYIDLLPDLLLFYKKTLNYFPLANIYLGIGKIQDGIEAIKNGLEFWFNLHNYKIMYYLCELANVYDFSIENRKKIYEIIEKCNCIIQKSDIWDKQKRWNVQKLKMRECLLNSHSIPYVTLEFVTSIECSNYSLLADFMQTVEQYLIPSNGYYSLEVRHNSPFDLLYTIFADEQTLFNAVVGIITILGVCDQFYSNHLKEKIKFGSNKNTLPENAQNQVKDKVTKNITNVHYNFYNCNVNGLDLNHFTKQSIGCENPESSGVSQ